LSSEDRFTYRDIPAVFAAILPWIPILGAGLVVTFPSLGATRPSTASIILIVVLTSFTRVFARWTRRPSRTFLAITVAAYIIAGVMLWGRLEGWLKLPK